MLLKTFTLFDYLIFLSGGCEGNLSRRGNKRTNATFRHSSIAAPRAISRAKVSRELSIGTLQLGGDGEELIAHFATIANGGK